MAPKAVVLLSGGMDSCVTAAIARERGFELCLLHLNYGQLTERRELDAFNAIADHYGVRERLVIGTDHLTRIGGSALTDRTIPLREADLAARDVPSSYVPFRNANILAMAVSWAEAIGAEAVFIGAVYEDSSGYPDCRPEFYEAFNRVVALGTRAGNIRVETPVIGMSKAAIVREGVRLGAPLHLTWSCYRAEGEACGTCDSCALRLRGFEEAGVEDPIPYAVRPSYRRTAPPAAPSGRRRARGAGGGS